MRVIVLKVKGSQNLAELEEVIEMGRTYDGGWQMIKDADFGDLAVWYAGAPDQDYLAYGWVGGRPAKPSGSRVKFYGPVVGVRAFERRKSRQQVAEACGFNERSVNQLAESVPEAIADTFLRAVGFDRRFVAARERISAEMAWALASAARNAPPEPLWVPGRHVVGGERASS